MGEVQNADSLYRSYTTHYQDYVLKARDIISLRVASITPSEFDFVQKYEEQLGLIRKLNQYEQGNVAGGFNQRILGGGGGMGIGGGADGVMNPVVLDRMQTGFILDEKGELELPYIGNIQLAGLTLAKSEALIKEKLQGYFETPVVRLQLLSFHYTILGEIRNEGGRYTIFDPNATIFDALTMAGNLNDFADRSRIKVIRTEGNVARVYYVNLLQEDILANPGYYIRPNDLIVVPPLQARATRRYTLPTTSSAISLVSSTLTLLIVILSLNR
jgi:polysaccharide biosynthesis/export protein